MLFLKQKLLLLSTSCHTTSSAVSGPQQTHRNSHKQGQDTSASVPLPEVPCRVQGVILKSKALGPTLLSENLEQKKCFAKGKASCVAIPDPPEINIV